VPLDFTRSWGLLSHSQPLAPARLNTSSHAISVRCENPDQSRCACNCPDIANQLTPKLTPEFFPNPSVRLQGLFAIESVFYCSQRFELGLKAHQSEQQWTDGSRQLFAERSPNESLYVSSLPRELIRPPISVESLTSEEVQALEPETRSFVKWESMTTADSEFPVAIAQLHESWHLDREITRQHTRAIFIEFGKYVLDIIQRVI
jgi:hypothetical protein